MWVCNGSGKFGYCKGCIGLVGLLSEVFLLSWCFTDRYTISGQVAEIPILWDDGYFLSRLETRTKECNMLARV